MRIKLAISCVAIALLAVVFSQNSAAQVNLQVQIGVPTVRFETAPVLVEVSPGVQVVPDYDQEVFFVDGWYWYRSGPAWYRTHDHRGGWVVVHRREVPRGLVRIPPGRYKHYRAEGPRMNEPRREMTGHRGQGQFKREERKEHNERGRVERNSPQERQERRGGKDRGGKDRGGKEHGEPHGGHR
ncbi:MAG TPA: hypothetical protein VJ801_07200 [Polyangia bacterium]|jgi:hypothetical protein|nr:hypothetical protein [Polyangia bacterium]